MTDRVKSPPMYEVSEKERGIANLPEATSLETSMRLRLG
jgi:hypothetical protein